MDNELQDALKVIGFDKLYERYIPQLHPPNTKGERIALSPFPFTSSDTNPSFSVNVNNGLWQDWHADISGNFVQFVAYLTAEWNEESGKPEPDFNEAERQLKVEFGISKELDKIWLAKVQSNLTVTSAYHKQWKQIKPWNEYILASLGIGFDTTKQRFVFPILNRVGTPITCRLYKPKVDSLTPKVIWLNDNLADSYLFPYTAWSERWNILVEGEPDAISLRSIGFPGCSGTLGASSPVPSGLWWKDRDIYLCFDNDTAGERATRLAIDIMKNDAKSLRLISLPKQFKDISDWLFSLSLSGLTIEEIQQEVTQLLVDAKSVQVLHQIYDAPVTPLPYEDALSSLNIAKKISFLATVIARSSQTFSLATNVTATCPASGHKYCGKCNMRNKFKGNARIIIDPRSAIALKLINAAEKDIFLAIKESQDIVIQCEDCNMQVVASTDVESILVSPSQSELSDRHINPSDNKRNEALILSNRMVDVESNQDYTLEGLVYAHPKNQKLTFVIDRAIRQKTDLETFAVNDDVYNILKQFQPVNETPIQAIIRQCTDMADSFTMIKNRLDLHVAYSTVWHSTIRFPFLGQVYERGWIDALVVGDTRCIEGDAVLHINRASLGRQYTIKEAYQKFYGIADRGNWDQDIPTYCRSLVNGELRQHLVKGIRCNGIKDVWRVTLKSGKTLKMTPDHKLITPDGIWMRLDNLSIGDNILSNGSLSRPGPQNGNWKGGRSVREDGYIYVSCNQDHPRANQHGQVMEHILVMESIIGRYITLEERVHHKDENRSNNEPDNLILCTNQTEHMKFHQNKSHLHFNNSDNKNICFLPIVDTIVSIEPAGQEEVYDMVMDDPHRNFVANDIIVHNCGKSATFQRMAKVLGTGTLIDCKLLTMPGILGAVETSSLTGERYVVAGLLPQNDMRGPILMDEFVAGRWDRIGILDHLSSTRAEGVVRISKAASAQFNARVRLIWSANPGRGRLLRDIGTYGCEVIPKIINQPEDIARFDFALAVSQHDVSAEEINSMIVPTQPIYTTDSRRLLLLWAWTRKIDQILWANGAEEAVINYSKFMYTKYDSSIPLVEASDQRHRIAKVAISIAMQCFSTEDGVTLIVKPEHVYAAVSFMCSWFDNPSMGYDRFSHDAARNREVIEPGYIISMMMEIYNIQAVPLAKQLLKTSEFSERTFSILVPSDGIVSQRFMSQLISHNCVQPAKGLYKDTWEITAKFGELLRNFIKVHKTVEK